MATARIVESSDTLRDTLRLAENIKIAYELVEEKSPKGNKKLNYLLKNLCQEIDFLLATLYGDMKPPNGDSSYEEVDFEVVVDDDTTSEDEKVM
jgi:hypothetical protein